MAIYHFAAKIISRSTGRSATAAAAYRAGLDIVDERTGELHAYSRRQGVLDHAVLTPNRAPDWAKDAVSLWNAVEQFEKRKDAQLAREIVVALPHELSLAQNRALLHAYVQDAFVARGMAVQVDIHGPDRDGDQRNTHAHLLLTTRQLTRNGFKAQKARNWNERKTLVAWREQWADHLNRALERAGRSERVDAGSFKARGIEDRAPGSHLGPAASQMERRGEATRIGDENRAAHEFNRLNQQAKVIDLAIERAKRAQAAEQRQAEARKQVLVDRDRQTAEAEQRAIDAGMAHAKALSQGKKADKTGAGWPQLAAQQARHSINDRRHGEPVEAWANRKRAELQSHQLDERGELGRRHDRATLRVQAQLEQTYGGADSAWQAQLAAIRARQARGGLWYSLTQAKQDRADALNLERSLADSAQRQQEVTEALAHRQAAERRALELAHEQAQARLEQQLERAWYSMTREGPSVVEEVKAARQRLERERDRTRDFDRDF
ncbi:MAG: MobA/MobL family protein [Candidatus Competibacteraceae bacterium]|nr:MobA/MobL family protein [Candidatus Competibacteraceae bacterium]